jgi:hypothetical protein
MKRHCVLGVLVAGVSACGSSPDYSPNFAGIWTGQATYVLTDVATGQQVTTTGQAYQTILGDGPDSLVLTRFCDLSNAGPHATPDSATDFSVHPYNCTAYQNGCYHDFTVTGGSGSLTTGTLTLTLTGSSRQEVTATCGAATFNYTLTLVATRLPT